MRNPFEDDIFSEFPAPSEGVQAGVDSIHGKILRRIIRELADAASEGLDAAVRSHGSTILLTAPRAGYGKTHLLARLKSALEKEAVVVNIRFNLEELPGWDTLLRQTLAGFSEADPEDPSVDGMQATGRWIFASLTARLIECGEVPSASPESAVAGLRRNFLRVFDPKNEDLSVLDWLTNNFEQLRPAMARILARARKATESGAAFWLDIFRGANDEPAWEDPHRLDACVPVASPGGGEARIAKLRLADFCRIVSARKPVVFLFDHLDCFHGDIREGLRVAYLLAELRSLSAGQTSILAANDDLWQSAFGDRLPSALADRLTASPARLEALGRDEALDLLSARCEEAGIPDEAAARFLTGFDPGHGSDLTPRAVLRKARAAWNVFVGVDPAGGMPDSPTSPSIIADGFPGGLLSEFGSDIPSVGELMDVETARRARSNPPQLDSPPQSSGFSPFLSEPEESYINGPHSLQSILKNAPVTPSDAMEPRKLDLASLRQKAVSPTAQNPLQDARGELSVTRLPSPRPPYLGRSTHQGSGEALSLHPLVTRFQSLRDAAAEGPFVLEPARLNHLIALCGAQSPIIDCEEITLSDASSDEGTVLRWSYAGSEILIALARQATTGLSRDFWNEFLDFPENGHEGAKLVAFTLNGCATGDVSGFAIPHVPEEKKTNLDIITILPETAATLRAASDLIEDLGAIAPATPGEALGVLADELDFFWRRLTRPLASANHPT